jgi:flagellar FliL protein
MAVSAVKAEPAATEAAPRPAGKKGLIKLVLVGVLVSSAAGGGAWWYLGHNKHADEETAAAAKPEATKPPVFIPLEAFTVNLVLVDNPQFLQTGITLKVADSGVADAVKLNMPVVRDRILMLMSSRKAPELLSVEGKRKLGDDIIASMNEILGAGTAAPATDKDAAAAKDGAEKDKDKDKAADEEEDEEDADAKAAKAKSKGKGKNKSKTKAKEADKPVQAVLFTSFIIQ